MLIHYAEENDQFIIGVYSVDNDPSENIDIIQKNTGWVFDKVKHTLYEDVAEFEKDTLVIHSGLLNDIEIYDVLQEGISVHITTI